MRTPLAAIGILFMSTVALSATIYVPDDYATIQGAINAAGSGDTVIVRPGTYVENIDFLGKAITVQSQSCPESTVIDGGQAASVVSFVSGEGSTSVIEGFTLTNGFGSGGPNSLDGGGIACMNSLPTILNNIISNNNADEFGGGISCYASAPKILGNVIADNFSNSEGAGIDCWDSSPTIAHNIIAGNFAVLAGGGISCFTSSPDIFNNSITGNSAIDFGGGIQCKNYSTPKIANTIFWNNSAALGPEIALIDWFGAWSDLTISYSDVEGGQAACFVDSGCTLFWNAGMIDADPLFVDPVNGDHHLTWNSPCRDTGDNTIVTDLNDFEGDPRIALGTVDMGADEYFYHLYHMGDVTPGSPIDVKVVGYPAAPVLLALGSGIQDPPVSTQHGDLWLNWPPLWQGNIGTAAGDGLLVLPVSVPINWTPNSEHPLQALVGPWNGPWTLLTNLEVLTVE